MRAALTITGVIPVFDKVGGGTATLSTALSNSIHRATSLLSMMVPHKAAVEP
jgi:hypothetical protein